MSGLVAAVAGIGILAPGFDGWENARQVLAGSREFQTGEYTARPIEGVSPRERRRLTGLIRQALQTAQEALAQSDLAADQVSTIFVSADGDLQVSEKVLAALTLESKPVSPTLFHQSVHNAPAGYWHNIHNSNRQSVTLCGGEQGCETGMLEVFSQVACSGEPALLVIHDEQLPEVFAPFRPASAPFAAALMLVPAASSAAVSLELVTGESSPPQTVMQEPALERVRQSNPAARVLPLLQALARRQAGRVQLGENCVIDIRITPGQG